MDNTNELPREKLIEVLQCMELQSTLHLSQIQRDAIIQSIILLRQPEQQGMSEEDIKNLKKVIRYQVEAYGGKVNPKDDFNGFVFDIQQSITSRLPKLSRERLVEIITKHLQLKPMADLGCSGLYLSMNGVEALADAIMKEVEG